ncbi:hypothetical protein K501DRAFT_280560 [Backusella circina FSU 941]|nr:hypothetical protein K501DRAFT_280560 [Backusella circina FSU 941]
MKEISKLSKVDISFNTKLEAIELFGTEKQVKEAYTLLTHIPILMKNLISVAFILELATEQREFISGKKNGKINKITKTNVVTIRFETSNKYNLNIILESNESTEAMEGLALLQDEMPAEISFYIPEVYHRRIIGVGGKNIQKIMKRYGVYVKFLGAEEFSAMGGYFENEHNVVARTPMKNRPSLDYLRQSVTEFITMQEDKDFSYTFLDVPFHLHREIQYLQSSVVSDVCSINNCKLWWPERLGQCQLTLFGPQCQLASIKEFITRLVPYSESFVLPWSLKLETLLLDPNQEWQNMVMDGEARFYIIENDPSSLDQVVEWVPYYSQDKYIMFRVSLNYSNPTPVKFKDAMISFLETKGIHVSELNLVQIPGLVSDTLSEKNISDIDNTQAIDISNESVCLTTLPLDEAPLRAIFESIPSPPLTEQNSNSFFKPYDKKDAVSSLFSASYPTGKNIWASEQQATNQKTSLLPLFTPDRHQLMSEPNSDIDALPTVPPPPGLYPYIDRSKTISSFGPIIDRSKQIPDMFLGGRDLFERSQLRSLSMPLLGINQQFGSDTFQPSPFKPMKRHSLPNDMTVRHEYRSNFVTNIHYDQSRPHSFNI